jgi:hypothetical protein
MPAQQPKPSVEAMRQHIEELLVRYQEDDVGVRWIERPDRARVLRAPESHGGEVVEIQIPRIRSSVSYSTALHEIGHAQGKYQRSRHEMVRERWAWEWARRNAIVWTDEMERHASKALQHIMSRQRR